MPVVYRETIKQIEKLRKKLKDGQQKNIEGLDRLKEALEGAAESADKLVKRYVDLINRICRIADETEFVHLYDKKKQLFSIGYNIEENSLTIPIMTYWLLKPGRPVTLPLQEESGPAALVQAWQNTYPDRSVQRNGFMERNHV